MYAVDNSSACVNVYLINLARMSQNTCTDHLTVKLLLHVDTKHYKKLTIMQVIQFISMKFFLLFVFKRLVYTAYIGLSI